MYITTIVVYWYIPTNVPVKVFSIFIVAPCILFQFTKKIQQMHLKSILKNTAYAAILTKYFNEAFYG
jgi:hypothetical protein